MPVNEMIQPSTKGKHSKGIVPKKPLIEIIPFINSPRMSQFLELLAQRTGELHKGPSVTMTPRGRHIDRAVTDSGSKLMSYSPLPLVNVTKENTLGETEEVEILFFIREQDRKEKIPNALLSCLAAHGTPGAPVRHAVSANTETRNSQGPRSALQSQRTAVGNRSAKDILVAYFEKHAESLGITINLADLNALNLNLCHVLGVAIANKAITELTGEPFNTQVKDNIFAGSRALNVSMFPIENSLLKMIEENEVEEVEYIGVCVPYEEVHAVHSLSLGVKVRTHTDSLIEFSIAFDPEETRIVSSEVTTAIYTFLKAVISSPQPKQKLLQDIAKVVVHDDVSTSVETEKVDDLPASQVILETGVEQQFETPIKQVVQRSRTPEREAEDGLPSTTPFNKSVSSGSSSPLIHADCSSTLTRRHVSFFSEVQDGVVDQLVENQGRRRMRNEIV